MRKALVLVTLAALALLVTACQPQMSPTSGEALEEEAVMEAGEKTGETLNLLIEARASGDFTALESFLATEDPEGDVRKVLDDAGALASAPVVKSIGSDLPAFWEKKYYKHGDVLVSKGAGTITSTLMELALPRGYSHGGILDMQQVVKDNWDAGCVLSADVDYLSSDEEGKFALTYETYAGWQAGNEDVTVLRMTEDVDNLPLDPINPIGTFFASLGQGEGTVYAFLGYPGTPYKAFEPIPKDDPTYWYCSKVPWRVFRYLSELDPSVDVDIEAHWFYGINDRYEVFTESLLYQLYRIWIMRIHGWRWWQFWHWPQIEKEAMLGMLNVLDVLITPDELRAWPGWHSIQTFPAGSTFDHDCWADYGGWYAAGP
jgi:hypothetical protein